MTKNNKNKKVLLVGWDAADWKIIDPLLQKGSMPNLQRLMINGSSGTIQTLDPPLSPMLWTSIATGKTADKHGILGFIEPDPKTSEPRPASVTSRSCKAVWNILTQENLKTNVVGWWPSHPAEPVNGIYVSNMFTKSDKQNGLMAETVYPDELTAIVEKLRVYPEDITLAELLPFVEDAEKINQEKDKHLHNLAGLLSNCNSINNVAKYMLKENDWNFTGVYFDTIDQVSHTFMKFYPPQMAGVPDEYFRLYKNVVSHMYVHHDAMLGELLELAGEDVTVILVSDHGFYSDQRRPVRLPNDPASPALEHAPLGIICISGEGVRPGEKIKGANLLDITPTILNIFDLPAGADMDGRVLSEIIQEPVIHPIETWETVPGNSGMHAEEKLENSWYSTEAMFQMMELGYVERLHSDKEQSLKKIISESHYYMSRVLMNKKNYVEALPILKTLVHEHQSVYRYGLRYAACLQYLWKNEEAREAVVSLRQKCSREISNPSIIDAILLSCEGNHEQALELFLDIERVIKHLPQLYVMIGNEFSVLNNVIQAEIFFLQALQLEGQHIPALQGLCFSLRQQGKETAAAMEQLELITTVITPDFKNTLNGLNDLDFNPDQTIDFRKYQLIIRLFLEQFHKGVKAIH